MNIDEIKNTIENKDYDFLRNNPHLGENIIYLTLGGSHAYGTNVETSDLDIRGIAGETKRELLGLSEFQQFTETKTDTTIYGLKKMFNLLINCNPNTIELLGTKKEHILFCSDEGKLLRENVSLFLSQQCIESFGGYATAQLRRLENALAKDSYPQDEKEKHILASLQRQMNHFKRCYKSFDENSINLYIGNSERKGIEKEILMDINLQNYPLRDFKDIYSEMHNVVKDYSKLNHRNRKKSDQKLYKHAMHLIRLYLMLIDILEGKGIQTYRQNDLDLLMAIRNEQYTFQEIFEMTRDYEDKLTYAIKHTDLPQEINLIRAEELLIEINERLLKKL